MSETQRQMTWDEVVAQMVVYRNERDALGMKIDALAKDAARYRFIRDGNAYIEPNHYDEDGIVTKEMYMAMETGKYYKDMRDFDMDIDEGITAIAKENKT